MRFVKLTTESKDPITLNAAAVVLIRDIGCNGNPRCAVDLGDGTSLRFACDADTLTAQLSPATRGGK